MTETTEETTIEPNVQTVCAIVEENFSDLWPDGFALRWWICLGAGGKSC